MHARHGLQRDLVQHRAGIGAGARRVEDGGLEHAIDPHVDGVAGLAGGFGAGVEAGRRLADQAEGRAGGLGFGIPGYVQGGGGFRQIAIGDAAAGVDDEAGFRRKARDRHRKPLRRSLEQHGAGGGAEDAEMGVGVADGKAAAGDAPRAVEQHLVVGAGGGGFDGKGCEGRVQLLRQQLGGGRVDALAALRKGVLQDHAAIRLDGQVGRHLPGVLGAAHGLGARRALGQAEGQDQAAGQAERAAA